MNNKDDFDIDFLLIYLLEYILEETLGGEYIFQHVYMNRIGWSETYVHFYHDHNY